MSRAATRSTSNCSTTAHRTCPSVGSSHFNQRPHAQPGAGHPLAEGDCLYVDPGLALEVRARPPTEAREPKLEATLALRDDEGGWLVYRDFLEERGDPHLLSDWLRGFPSADAAARRAKLGPLADATQAGLVEVQWAPSGLLETVVLSRQALAGVPGAWWLVEQLGRLPVARFLRALQLGLFAGAASALEPGAQADDEAARLLEALASAPFASALRTLSLGFVSLPHQWPRCGEALARLRALAPALRGELADVIHPGGQASVHVLHLPPALEVVSVDVVLNPAHRRGHGAQLSGASDWRRAPRSLHLSPAERRSVGRLRRGRRPLRQAGRVDTVARSDRYALHVNGLRTLRCGLAPGDVVEPIKGLSLRFEVASR